MPQLESKDGKFYVSTAADVAQCFGVTPDTVKQWRARGMPGTPKRYVLEHVARWLRTDGPWADRKIVKPDDPLMDGVDSPGLERYRLAKAEHAELDLAERRKELIEREKCREVLSRWAVVIRRMGERLVKRYGAGVTAEFDQTLAECGGIVEEAFGNDS